jgi:hypothetical protein
MVVIDGFGAQQLGLAPLAFAAGPLKDMLGEALTNAVMFKLKAAITWQVRTPMSEDGMHHDYNMNFNAIDVRQDAAPLGGGEAPRIAALLQKIRQSAFDKMDFAKLQASALVFERIKEIRFTMIPHPRELSLEARWGGALPPEVGAGGCTVKLPEALVNKMCCLNILNKDSFCFRYCLIAWAKGTAGVKHAERPAQYLCNAPSGRAGGRPPKGFVPNFDDGNLDFSMLTFPVELESITPFEEANNIGVWRLREAGPCSTCPPRT